MFKKKSDAIKEKLVSDTFISILMHYSNWIQKKKKKDQTFLFSLEL